MSAPAHPSSPVGGRRAVRTAVVVVGAVAVRPVLWLTALRALRRTAVRGWWHRAPFLPVPGADYLAFRLVTQYGDAGAQPSSRDVVNYLTWLRQWDRAAA